MAYHFHESFLKFLPPTFASLANPELSEGPDLGQYMFAYVQKDLPEFTIGEGADARDVPLYAGDGVAAAYTTLQPALASGHMRLR